VRGFGQTLPEPGAFGLLWACLFRWRSILHFGDAEAYRAPAGVGELWMQTDNRLFDDLARVANGAINTLSGVREEIENRLRERVESWLTEMDMVPREEFEAIKEIAQKARAEQEDLSVKVAALEQQLAAVTSAAKPRKPARAAAKPTTRRRKAAPKPAAKSAD